MAVDRRPFIRQHTRLQRPTFVPEIQLYLADEVMPIWRECEKLGNTNVPFWAFAWPGGQAIARYLLDGDDVLAGRRVLDLAAGSGLCAITAAKAGAASVLASDIDAFSEEAVTLNAVANDVTVSFTNRDLLDHDPPDVDLILAGDLWYEQPMAGRVLTWLESAHARGIRVLMGDPGRPIEGAGLPHERLIQLADYEIPVTRELEDRDVKRVGLFTFPVCRSAVPATEPPAPA